MSTSSKRASSTYTEVSDTTPSKPQQMPPNPVSTHAHFGRLWVLFAVLCALVMASSWALIARDWHRPLMDLFLPSMQLDMGSMVVQMTLLASSLVALLAGGLLGAVSILLQQLVKNPLASDTTLGVGAGAQLAILLVSLFIPSLAIYGGMYVAFVGALISMGLVLSLIHI